MEKSGQYYVAILIKGKAKERLEAERNAFSKAYGTSFALRNEVHVTLVPPFHATDAEKDVLIEDIALVTKDSTNVVLKFNRYGHFGHNKVFYIGAEIRTELLDLRKQIFSAFDRQPAIKLIKPHDHEPHITLAYRDLDKNTLARAIQDYDGRTFDAVYGVEAFQLMRREAGAWIIDHEFKLNKDVL